MSAHRQDLRIKPIEYRITMATPIGARHGKLRLDREDNRLHGTLELLAHSEPFSGSIDADGHCTIRGCLVTLMRSMAYTATGCISDQAFELLLQGDRHVFPITGCALPESEEQQ